MTKLVLIALGGAGGTIARYAVSGWAQRLTGGAVVPVGTLTVNVAGCLLIGVLGFALSGAVLVREEYRVALLVGVLGGFTTFSSFGYETLSLLNDGQVGRAAANVLLNNGAGLVAVWLGYRLAEHFFAGTPG